jgi:hypothetical protein
MVKLNQLVEIPFWFYPILWQYVSLGQKTYKVNKLPMYNVCSIHCMYNTMYVQYNVCTIQYTYVLYNVCAYILCMYIQWYKM